MSPHFETNDDAGMSFIVEGIYGEKSAYIVFINVIIGKVLKILYTFIPLIKWYSVFQYGILFSSFTLLGYVILRQGKGKFRLLLFTILVPFTFECYVYLQFTKTAGIAVAVGILTLFFSLRNHANKAVQCLAVMVLVAGSMIRIQSMLMVSSIMFCLALSRGWAIYITCGKNVEKTLGKLKNYFISFGIAFLCILVAQGINHKAYESDEGWKSFLEYNEARYQLLDYGFPDWEENKEEYERLGISEEDITMYQNWTFADPDKLSLSRMRQINELKSKEHLTWSVLRDFLKDIPLRFLKMRFSLIVCTLLIVYLLLYKEKRWGVLVYLFVSFLASYFYFFFMSRYLNINRIDIIYIFSMVCVLIELMGTGVLVKKTSFSYAMGGMIALSCINVLAVNNKNKISSEQKESELVNQWKYQEFYKLTTEDVGKLYLENTGSIQNNLAFNMWQVAPQGMSRNRYSLGNWLTASPLSQPILKEYRVRNPFKDVIDNPHVYLINNAGADTELSYIQRNYAPDAKAASVKQINGFNVFKIYTQLNKPYGENVIKNSTNISSSVEISFIEEDKTLLISGTAYKKNMDSFKMEFYIDIYDVERDKHDIQYLTQFQTDKPQRYNGKYGGVNQVLDVSGKEKGTYNLKLNLRADNENYLVAEEHINIE